MNGTISVKSEVGKGTSFFCSFVVQLAKEAIPPSLQFNIADIASSNILVVDDNEKHLDILCSQLNHFNIHPVRASSGKQALQHLQEKKPFDLVITDLSMPGMDGIELAKSIKNKYPHLPIVLLSAFSGLNSTEDKTLFSASLTKPAKHQMLYRVISNELSKNAPVTETASTTKLVNTFALAHPLKILIAEDNAINQFLIVTTLKKLGYHATTVNDGLMAIEELNNHEYDLVLMDMQMPEMDGIEATIYIRKSFERQPFIIALTANAREEDRQLCLNAGMDDYISKPIEINNLISKLEKCYGKISASSLSVYI
jgi:CheY-like chemotaxis protein